MKSWIELNTNDYVAVSKLLKNVEIGKEYYLATGHHASIIRKSVNGFEFLELQDKPELNGFKKLTTERLKNRFDCKKSHTEKYIGKTEARSILIEIDSLSKNNDFKRLLGYINTNEIKQQKGAGGRVL